MKNITVEAYQKRARWDERPTLEGLARKLGSRAKTRVGMRRAVLKYIAERPSRFEIASRPRPQGYSTKEEYKKEQTQHRLCKQVYHLLLGNPPQALAKLRALHPRHYAGLSRAAAEIAKRPVDLHDYLVDNWLGVAHRKYTPYLQDLGTYTTVGRYVVYRETQVIVDWNRYSKTWHTRFGPSRTVAYDDIVIRWLEEDDIHERRISIKGKATKDPLAYAFLEAGLAKPSKKDLKLKRHQAYRLEPVGKGEYARFLGDTFFDYIICDEGIWVCGRTLDAAKEAYVSKIAEAMR